MSGDKKTLDIVLLACGPAGMDVATRLAGMPVVGRLLLLTAPFTRRRRSPMRKLRLKMKYEGCPGLLDAVRQRMIGEARRHVNPSEEPKGRLPANVLLQHVADFHDADARTALREFNPTLGLVVGTKDQRMVS